MKLRALWSLALAAELLLFNQLAFAHTMSPGNHNNVTPHSTPVTGSSFANSLGTVNLDLGSTKATVSAGNLALANALNINVGGHLTQVNAQSMLTAAELVAVMQVQSTGVQTLKLGAQGNAVGGVFSLPGSLSVGNLDIPQGVKELDNAALTPSLSLSGDLVDAGKFIVFTSKLQATSAQVSASNIYVQAGGFLTSDGLQGVAPVDLSLSALNSFSNAGVVSSSGNLSLYAASGNFTNSGTISTATGNINVSALKTSDINFNGAGGTLAAPNGAISFRDANYAGSANMNLSGGNYLSQSLNLYAGSGSVNMNVGQVTGLVNTYAGCAHLSANTPNLNIGILQVTGDPWVDSPSGNINLDGNTSVPYLVATAAGSIYVGTAGESIDTSADGGNVVLAAGVTATDNGGILTLSRSNMGGSVWLSTGKTFDSTATQNISGFQTGGGNVTLIAMTDTGTGSTNGGYVNMPGNVTLNTTGTVVAGSVTIIAESVAGAGNNIEMGSINAAGTGGQVSLQNATPNLAGATIDSTNGNVAGSFLGSTLQNGSIDVDSITAGGALSVQGNATVNFHGTYTAPSVSITAGHFHPSNGTSISATAGDLSINAAQTVLTLLGDGGSSVTMSASGQVSIGSAGTTTFQASNASGTTFILDGTSGMTITEQGRLTIDANITLENQNSSGAWTITAPTVALNDGATISTTPGGASITIHTNNLNLGDGTNGNSTTITGTSITIDDAVGAGGLTITGAAATNEFVTATVGNLTINATTGGTSALTFAGDDPAEESVQYGSPTAVNVTASGSITFGVNSYVINNDSAGSWTLKAPQITFEDVAGLNVTGIGPGTGSLTIHTNNLVLSEATNPNNYDSMYANTIFIDDAGFAANSGLTIQGTNNITNSIVASVGSITVNATNGGSDQLNLNAGSGSGTQLVLVGSTGVNLNASSQITVGEFTSVANGTSSASWTMEAPTVQVKDGAEVNTTGGTGAVLTVHTNKLELGDGSNSAAALIEGNSVTINDVGMPAGHSIFIETLDTTNSFVNGIDAATGILTVNATNGSPSDTIVFLANGALPLALDSNVAVNITALSVVILEGGVTVGNTSSTGPWTITCQVLESHPESINTSGRLGVGGTGADLTIHANSVNIGGTISGNNVTINDATLASGGVRVVGTIDATAPDGTIQISAGNGTANLTMSEATLDANGGVSLSATGTLIINGGTTLKNSTSTGNWTLTAPTVTLVEGSKINATNVGLTITTNNLNLGNGSTGFFPTVTITSGETLINDSGHSIMVITLRSGDTLSIESTGTLTISSGSSLLITSSSTSGATVDIDGVRNDSETGVTLSAATTLTLDQNINLTMNNTSGSGALIAPAVQLNDGAQVNLSSGDASAGLTINTNNLNLGNGTNGNGTSITSSGFVAISDANMTTGGLVVNLSGAPSQTITASNGALSLTATNGSASLVIQPQSGVASSSLELASNSGITLESSQEVEVASGLSLSTNWSTVVQLDSAASFVLNGQMMSTYSGTGYALAAQADGFDPLVMTMGQNSLFEATVGSIAFNPGGVSNVDISATFTNNRYVMRAGQAIFFNPGNGIGTVTGNVQEIDGTVNARGSSVTISANSSNPLTVGTITVPTAGGAIALNNMDGDVAMTAPLTSNGGALTVVASGNITGGQNVSASSSTGNGGTIVLSGQSLLVGSVTSNGASTGSGGLVSITSTGTGTLTIGGATTNGTTGSVTALGGSTSGDGGQVFVSNSGTGGVTIGSLANISVVPQTEGAGGTVNINAGTGTLTIAGGTILADAVTAGSGNHIGGTITLQAQSITASGSNGLMLSANGVGTGMGGTVIIVLSSASSDISIGNPSGNPNNIFISVNGGTSGSAGSVTLGAGQDLTVDPGSLSATAGTGGGGATYMFTAGRNLLVTGTLTANADGGAGGMISLVSNVSTASGASFNINSGEATNGVNGDLSVNGGTAGTGGIIVHNDGGSILIGDELVTTQGNETYTVGGHSGQDSWSCSICVISAAVINVNAPNISNTGTVGATGSLNLVLGDGGTFTNNGTFVGDTVSVQSPGALVLAGGNGTTTGIITSTDSTAAVVFSAPTSIAFANGTNYLIQNSGSGLSITTADMIVGGPNDSGNVNAGIAVKKEGSGNCTCCSCHAVATTEITLPAGGAVTAGTLNLNGGPVTTTSTNLTLSAGVTLASDTSITMNVNGGTLTNNGVVTAPAISVASTSTLVLAGGNGSTQGVFNPTGQGSVFSIAAPTSISFANGTNVVVTKSTDMSSPLFVMGAPTDSGTVSATVASSGFVVRYDPSGTVLWAVAPNANFGTLNLDGGAFTSTSTNFSIGPGATLASDSPVVVNANGGTFTINGTLVGSGVTIQSTSTLVLSTDARGTIRSVNNSGGGTASVGIVVASSLSFSDGLDLAIEGPGGAPYVPAQLTITAPNLVLGAGADQGAVAATITADGGPFIVQHDVNGGGTLNVALKSGGAVTSGTLNLNGGAVTTNSTNLTVDLNVTLSSDSAVTVNANGGTLTLNGALAGQQIAVQSTSTLTLAGGNGANGGVFLNSSSTLPVSFSAPMSISFADSSNLTADGALGVSISTRQLIVGASGDSGIVNAGFFVTKAGGCQTCEYSLVNVPQISLLSGGAVTSGTLNLIGGPVTATSSSFTVDSGATLSSDSPVTVNTSIFTLNGTVQGSQVSVVSTGDLLVGGGSSQTQGEIEQTGSSSACLLCVGSAANSVTFANGTNWFLDTLGTISRQVNLLSGSVVLGSSTDSGAVSVIVTSDANVVIAGDTNHNIAFALNDSGNVTSGTLDFIGAVTTTSANLTIAQGVTLAAEGPATLNVNSIGGVANTGVFTNNGTVRGQDISVLASGTLELAGGTSANPSVLDVVFDQAIISAAGNISFANGTNIVVTKITDMSSPGIVMGAGPDSGAVQATLSVNDGETLTWTSTALTPGSFTIANLSGVTSSQLNLNTVTTGGATAGAVSFSGVNLAMNSGTAVNAGGSLGLSATGTVTMQQNSDLSAGTSLNVSSSGTMTVANLLGYNGAVSATVSGAASGITVLTRSNITAVSGNVSLQNSNLTPTGTIAIQSNVTINAGSETSGQGKVFINVGSPASTSGKAPKNVKTVLTNGGTVIFGTTTGGQSVVTAQAPTNTIYVNGASRQVNFSGVSSTSITLGGGDVINASGVPALTSLDLTNSTVVHAIVEAQGQKLIGGKLITTTDPATGNLIVIGGTVILTPLDLAPVLTAENIPAGVTATFTGFSSSTPINFLLNASSTTPQVTINGTETFSGKTSPLINISSSLTGNVFNLGSTGVMTSAAGLTLDAAGEVLFSGIANAKTTLTVNTTGGPNANADITVSGTLGTSGSGVVLNAGGVGDILQGTPLAAVLGKTVSLTTSLGEIGGTLALTTKTAALTVNTGGFGGNMINNIGAMTFGGASTAMNLSGNLIVTNTGKLALNSMTDINGSISISATSTLTVNSGKTIEANDGDILLNSSSTKSGAIVVLSSATIKASDNSSGLGLGNVKICIGSATPIQTNPATPPLNITTGGTTPNQIFFGTNSIVGKTAKGIPNAAVNASGTDVTFSTAALKASAITLNGGDVITAQESPISFQFAGNSDDGVVDTGDDGQDAGDAGFVPVEALLQK